uniref:Uncharacterized protein n=1 Tax=Anopheles melas TaxID=34690 RepID=A0A182TQI3_9DIPT
GHAKVHQLLQAPVQVQRIRIHRYLRLVLDARPHHHILDAGRHRATDREEQAAPERDVQIVQDLGAEQRVRQVAAARKADGKEGGARVGMAAVRRCFSSSRLRQSRCIWCLHRASATFTFWPPGRSSSMHIGHGWARGQRGGSATCTYFAIAFDSRVTPTTCSPLPVASISESSAGKTGSGVAGRHRASGVPCCSSKSPCWAGGGPPSSGGVAIACRRSD